jgi:glycosyltransferase involved in cell wall biosynthesis
VSGVVSHGDATGVAASGPSGAKVRTGFLSIVVPCLNEEVTVGDFVDWCFEGLRRACVDGEVLIIDSSTDRSAEIAAAHGARVVRVPKRGLGRAYIDAIPHVRGEWVIMGDCDLTYDFRELEPFVEQLRAGAEFVMGSRTKGSIEPGAMPKLHRYFGSPTTTWIFNRIYRTRLSDIHCGMRAMTLDALKRMQLESQGWEYASEMILKAKKRGLRTTEVPVSFYKDPEGRESHLKRVGWAAPWKAGWSSLEVMFLYAPDFFLLLPGMALLSLGLALLVALGPGPLHIGSLGLDLHWMLLALVIAVLGYSAVQLAVLARVHYNFSPRFTERVLRLISYNRGVLASVVLVVLGLIPNVALLVQWLGHGLKLSDINHPAVLGLALIVLGFQTFAFTLLLHIVGREHLRASLS